MREEIEKKIHEFIEHMYEIGYEDGQKDIIETSKETAAIGYEKGLNDAWATIKKIIPLWEKGYTWYIFDSIDIDWIFKRYSASEAGTWRPSTWLEELRPRQLYYLLQ